MSQRHRGLQVGVAGGSQEVGIQQARCKPFFACPTVALRALSRVEVRPAGGRAEGQLGLLPGDILCGAKIGNDGADLMLHELGQGALSTRERTHLCARTAIGDAALQEAVADGGQEAGAADGRTGTAASEVAVTLGAVAREEFASERHIALRNLLADRVERLLLQRAHMGDDLFDLVFGEGCKTARALEVGAHGGPHAPVADGLAQERVVDGIQEVMTTDRGSDQSTATGTMARFTGALEVDASLALAGNGNALGRTHLTVREAAQVGQNAPELFRIQMRPSAHGGAVASRGYSGVHEGIRGQCQKLGCVQ